MNERIKLLAEQAGLEFDDDLVLEPEPIYYIKQKEFEKFAELIVLECTRVAAQTPCPYEDEDARKTFGHTWDMACIESARDIRKHFGVEE